MKRKRESNIEDWIDSSFKDIIDPLEKSMRPFRDETMEKWLNKVNAANGIAALKKFKVINQSISAQIESALQSDKIWKRTKLCRTTNQKVPFLIG